MAEDDGFDAVLVAGDLTPWSAVFGFAEVVCEFTAVAIGDCGVEPAAVVGGFEFDFGDAGEVATGAIGIGGDWGAEFVEVDLLEEVEVGLGFLALMRIAGVVDAGAVGEPCGGAAAGGVLDAGDAVGEAFAGVGAEEVEGTVFAAVFGETDGDEFSVGRGDEPIHGDLAFGFEFVGVEDDAFGGEVVRRG